MTPAELQSQYRGARIFIAMSFTALILVLVGMYAVNYPGGVTEFAVQAYENPTQVISNVITGVAQQ
ncbi:MAG: hypothetical protein Q8P95_04680 [bacterium]|nr:hypothetical protein [bacterium]